MKVSPDYTPTRSKLQSGDAFLDSDGDFNVVTEDGRIVCFFNNGRRSPFIREMHMDVFNSAFPHDITVLPAGTTVTITV